MATLFEHAASIVRNSLHRSWHAREQSAEPYGLPDDGVRMVMSEFGVAAYDIWRTAADQRATETLHPWRNTMADRSVYTTLNRLRGRWQRMLRNRRSMAEVAACPPNELSRIALDVGLSHTDLRALGCSHPGPSELMPRRLRQLGFDPAYVKIARTATYQDLERVCGACKSWQRCARDLAKRDVRAGMSGYCLNAFTINALTVDPPIVSTFSSRASE
jgi:hypothetical protein